MTGRNFIKALLPLLFLASPAPPAAAQSAGVPLAMLSGRVSNLLSGSPVRKARVILSAAPSSIPRAGQNISAVTDVQGRYRFSNVPPGRYRLRVERTGFLPVSYGARGPNRPGRSILLAPGANKEDVNFTLEPPAVITGHIYDQEGEPLTVGVQLWRRSYDRGQSEWLLAAGGNSDDEGAYRLYGLPPGKYKIGTAQVPANPLSRMNPVFSRIGSLYAPASQPPVPPAIPEVYPQTFYPGAEEMTSAVIITLAAGSEARDIDFHLQKTVAVTVTIELEGPIAPGQNVSILLKGRDRENTMRANSNAGQFRISAVPPGPYILDASSEVQDQHYFAHVSLNVGTLDLDGVRVALQPAFALPGHIRCECDGPFDPAKLNVDLTRANIPSHSGQIHPSEKGDFSAENLEPGLWRISIGPLPPGMYRKTPNDLEITAETKSIEILLSDRGAQLEGKVTAPGAEPVEGATVLLISPANGPQTSEYVAKSVITGPEGEFSVSGIPPGPYRILAVEDLENGSWQDPSVLATLPAGGVTRALGVREKATQDLPVSR